MNGLSLPRAPKGPLLGSWQPSSTAIRVSLNCGNSGTGPDSLKAQAVRLQERCEELVIESVGSPPRRLVTNTGDHCTAPDEAPAPTSHCSISNNSTWEQPWRLTRRITRCCTVQDLEYTLQQHPAHELNSIHVAAALVKLAKLTRAGQHAKAQQHHRPGDQPHPSSAQLQGSLQHSTEKEPAMLQAFPSVVHQLAQELSNRYVTHAADYSTARQHANITWALGQLRESVGFQPSATVVSALQDALLVSQGQLLQAAPPQELSNLAWGLAKLQHHHVPLTEAVAQAATPQLASFKPQELANIVWGLCQACSQQGVTATHHQPVFRQPTNHDTWQSGNAVPQAGMPHTVGFAQAALHHAAQLLHAFKPQELVSLLRSAAQLGQLTQSAAPLLHNAVPVLVRHAHMHSLNSQDVSNSLWAYAKLKQAALGQALLSGLLQAPQTHTRKGGLSHRDTAPPPSSPAHLSAPAAAHPHQPQSQPATPPWVHQAQTQELVTVLWACGVFSQAQPAGFRPEHRQLADSLLAELARGRRRRHLTQQGVANALWAAARLRLADIRSRLTLLQEAAKKAVLMSPQELSKVLWSLAYLPAAVCLVHSTQSTITALLLAARQQIATYQPPALAQVAWAAGWATLACQRDGLQSRCCSDWFDDVPTTDTTTDADSVHTLAADDQQAAWAWYQAQWQPLLHALTHQSLLHIHSFRPADLSVLAQGLSYALPVGEGSEVFHAVGCAAVSLMPSGGFTPSGLTLLVAALSRVQAPHRELLVRTARSAAAWIELYSPVQLANLLWALTSAGVVDRLLLDRTAAVLCAGPLSAPNMSTAHSSSSPSPAPPNSPAASSQSGSSAPALQPPPSTALQEASGHPSHPSSYDESDLDPAPRSHSASLLSKLGWEGDGDDEDSGALDSGGGGGSVAGWQAVRQGLVDLHDLPWVQAHEDPRGWDTQSVALSEGYTEPPCSSPAMTWTVLIWAFAKSHYYHHQLYDRLIAAVLSTPPAIPHPAASQQQDAATATASQPAGLSPARQALAQLTTPCLVQLLWAVAVHDHSHPQLLREATPVLAARIHRGHVRPRDVATIAWAYAKLQHYEPLLFSTILREAQTNTNRYNLRSWSRLAWAFSTLCLPSEEAFFVRLSQLQRQEDLRRGVREGSAGTHGEQQPATHTHANGPATAPRSPWAPVGSSASSSRAGPYASWSPRTAPSGSWQQHHRVGRQDRSSGAAEQEWLGRHSSISRRVMSDISCDVQLLTRPSWQPEAQESTLGSSRGSEDMVRPPQTEQL